jgi:hypothetical protein
MSSYDNTLDLGADTWRHVAFVEQRIALDPGDSLVRAGAGRHDRDATVEPERIEKPYGCTMSLTAPGSSSPARSARSVSSSP